MRKKLLRVLFILIIIYILYNGFKLLIIEHTLTYKINNYKVEEHFYMNKSHFYKMTITKNKNNYTFIINKKLNKQKKILKNIKTYKSNNLSCIIPIYRKKVNPNIYCNIDTTQVSLDYLIKTNNNDFKIIKKKVKKYNFKYPSSNNIKTKYKNLTIYKKNILDENIYYLWYYKGVYIIDNKSNKFKKILDYDLYDNIMNTVVDRYYVLFENNSVNGIKNIYYYDSKKDKLNKFVLKTTISKDSYINGVVDNLIYVTDKREKKQYTINIKKEKIEEIDNEETSYITYTNNKLKTMSKSDFFMKKQYFNKMLNSNSNELIKSNDYYYYLENNKIYKSFSKDKKNPILLLELGDIKEWQVINNQIIILQNNTILSYTEDEGLRKIIESNELKYNYKNIYNLNKK